MTFNYETAKAAEGKLQELFKTTELDVVVDRISGADLYYTDGLASSSIGKLYFTNKKTPMYNYTVYFPMHIGLHPFNAEYRAHVDTWLAGLRM